MDDMKKEGMDGEMETPGMMNPEEKDGMDGMKKEGMDGEMNEEQGA